MNKQPTNQRRRLFNRLKRNLPPLALTKRDVSILNLVHDYRFLNSPQIHALIGGSKRNLSERLSRLFQHAYLDRPYHQRELRSEGYRVIVYALAPKGATLLVRQHGKPISLSPHLGENNRTAKRIYLAHTLMVSQFRTCLTLACRKRLDFDLSAWQVPDRPLARIQLGRHRASVIPDAYFAIKGKDGQSAHFFVEADRGTMTQARFLRKLQAYWRLRSREADSFVPHAFRVVTITQSKQRMENLVETAKNADPRHTGSRMFCFACEDAYGLERPEAIFAPIWRTPADNKLHSLLEGKGGSHAQI